MFFIRDVYYLQIKAATPTRGWVSTMKISEVGLMLGKAQWKLMTLSDTPKSSGQLSEVLPSHLPDILQRDSSGSGGNN